MIDAWAPSTLVVGDWPMNDQIRAALSPLSNAMRQRQALAHPISQVSLILRDTPDCFSIARREILYWINDRAGRPLPQTAWDGTAFELEEIGAQHAEAVAIGVPLFWAARLDDADKEIASRSWVTEVAIGESNDDKVLFGARLTAVVRGPAPPFERSIPSFVRRIVTSVGAELDGRSVSETPWFVSTEDDVEDLVSLLSDPNRRVDVIVAALAEGSSDPTSASVDVDNVARRTLGAAHVAVLSGPASYFLTDMVGKEFSVFRQAVRTYRPGFDVDLDEPFSHPLGLPERIAAWPNGGSEAYSRLVISQALIRSVSTADAERIVPSFLAVKRTAAQIRIDEAREAGSTESDLLALYEQDNEDLRRQLAQEKEKNDALLTLAEEERDTALDAAQQARETAQHLRRRIESLQNKLEAGTPEALALPPTLDDIQTWCEENLAGSVELHSRAYRGLKGSTYEDTTLIYDALLLLRDYYVPMRRDGGAEKLVAFQNRCQNLHLEEGPTASGNRAGEQGEEYFIRFGGRRVFLDRHLKKGTSRDPRYSFRLYFFWDDNNDQVVVGWLPSHLDSRIT